MQSDASESLLEQFVWKFAVRRKKYAGGRREKDYASSALRVQRELVDFDQFGSEEMETTEQQLVEFALNEWAIHPPTAENSTPGAAEDFEGYVPSGFFDRLTQKQEAFLRILWDADNPLETTEILRRMEEDYGLETKGSNTTSRLMAGMTRKFPSGYRRSIMAANWTGNEYEFRLVLDPEQQEQFAEAFGNKQP